MGALLFLGLAVLLVLGVPVGFSLGLSTILGLSSSDRIPMVAVVQRMFTGLDSFTLLAVPFFLMAGEIMCNGQMSKRLVKFGEALLGHIRGGIAFVSIVSSMFFAGVSGSGVADTAAIGTLLIPAMVERGYSRNFAAALQCAAGAIGPVIPPSIPMVFIGVVGGMSIGGLFAGGIVPGVLIGLSLMIVAWLEARKVGIGGSKAFNVRDLIVGFREAFFALFMPVVVLGGILIGVFTPTEAAAIAVVYSLVVELFIYRDLKVSELPRLVVNAVATTGMVMFIVATASAFAWLATSERVPQMITQSILGISRNKFVLLLGINILLLLVGCIMETVAAVIVLFPLLLPAVVAVGVDPIHFGVIVAVNLAIGLVTPPVGLALYVSCGIAKVSIEEASAKLPMVLTAMIAVLLLITYIPDLVMFIPRWLGYAL